jgi:hypothetical protein
MAGISRRCKRRPNSGVQGCPAQGPGTPPTVYPGGTSISVIKKSMTNPPAQPPRTPPKPLVKSATTVVVPFTSPVVPTTSGITVTVTKV